MLAASMNEKQTKSIIFVKYMSGILVLLIPQIASEEVSGRFGWQLKFVKKERDFLQLLK